ncbi:MAG: hypothetical protein QM765_51345 [Myxococcales bacterium]
MRLSPASPRPSLLPRLLSLALAGLVTGCPGGAPETFEVSAKVQGLTGKGLALSFNDGSPVAVAADGTLMLAQGLSSGDAFEVSVTKQPTEPNQVCTPQGGSGKVASADVVVPVVCTTETYALRVNVTGLLGTGLTLRNGSDELVIAAPGRSTFSQKLPSGQAYAITVARQPTQPSQTCVVASGQGTGTMPDRDVEVSVTCTTDFYAIRAAVTGLQGSGLELLPRRRRGGEGSDGRDRDARGFRRERDALFARGGLPARRAAPDLRGRRRRRDGRRERRRAGGDLRDGHLRGPGRRDRARRHRAAALGRPGQRADGERQRSDRVPGPDRQR